ncbi:MAG: DEAD/DEAH box helicase [Deltaproteobacteria bacterium]|nr:DEAD/DEAH box helicase [Deltaproteobacteria bacterium]
MSPMNNPVPSLQKSLTALSGLDFFASYRGVLGNIFQIAYKRIVDGDFVLDSLTEQGATFRVSYGRVMAQPVVFEGPVKKISDCFRFQCSCLVPFCEHSLCAGMILHKTAMQQFDDVRPLAKMKFGDLTEALSVFLEIPPPRRKTIAGAKNICLRALLFCIDNKKEGEQAWAQGQVFTDIPATKPIFPDDTLSRSRWIQPHDYSRSPFNESPDWNRPERQSGGWSRGLASYPFVVQYLFSDGTILDMHQILYHAYGPLIRTDLLLPFRDTCNDLAVFSGHSNNYGFDAERAMFRVLQKVFESRKDNFPIFFVKGKDRTMAREGLEIKSLRFISPDEAAREDSPAFLKLRLECLGVKEKVGNPQNGRVRLKLVWGQEGLIPFANFLWEPSTASLIFHPHRDKLNMLTHLQNDNFRSDEYRDCGSSSLPFPFPMVGHEKIEGFVKEIRSSSSLKNLPLIFVPKGVQVSSEQRVPVFSLTSDGVLRYGLRVNTELASMTCLNPSPWGRLLLKGFHSGFQDVLYNDREQHMVACYDDRRRNDLALLTHPGIFATVVMELTQAFVQGQEAPKWEDLFLKMAALIPKAKPKKRWVVEHNEWGEAIGDYFEEEEESEEEKRPRSLETICSKKAIKAVRTIIDHWFKRLLQEREALTFYTSLGPVVFSAYDRAFFLFLGELARRQALRTGGKCFRKSRTPVFNAGWVDRAPEGVQFVTGDDRSLSKATGIRFQGVEREDLLATALFARAHACEVMYEGLSLEGISTENFRTEFTLKEESESPAGVIGEGGTKINWFDLHPRFFLNGVEVDTEHVRHMNRTGLLEWNGRLYLIEDKKLPSVAYLEKFWNRLMSGSKENAGTSESSVCRLPRHQTLELLLLRKQGVTIQGGPEWEKICAFYDSLDVPREPALLPPSVHAELKPYQRTGVQWLLDLYQLRMGGILADDMGLGKTIQSLVFLDILRTRDEMGHVLIIVPTSLTYNWLSEGKRFTPEIPMTIFQSGDKEALANFLKNPQAAVICTYGLLVEHEEFFRQFSWNIHIYDEAQQLKNIASQRTSVSRTLPARFKLGLTGTPMENHLGECYSLLDLVVPGCLGSLEDFRKIFVNPMMIDPKALADLRLKIRPLILRRHKSEILKDLPDKTESLVILPFEERQKKIYRDIAISWNDKVQESVVRIGEARSQIMMLTALLRLRQACSDPSCLPAVKYPKDPPKVSLLMESLQEIVESGESALIFTQFLSTFERVGKRLKEEGVRHFSIHGGLSHTQRQREISSFQSCSEGAVFLMTLKTGGVGLNLTKATYVFHLEPWWNPAVENQATDRTHRIGQTNRVQVYRYLMKESVEEKIEVLKQRKSGRFQALFGTGGSGGGGVESESDLERQSASGGRLTKQDFDYLLGEGNG